MDLWLARLVLTHIHLYQHQQQHLLQLQILEPRVSVFLFSTMVLFFGGLPFALLVLQFRAAFSSLLFKQYIVKVDFYFNPVQCLDSHISTFSNEDTRNLFMLCIVFYASYIMHYLLSLFDLFFFCSLFIVHENNIQF